MTEEEILKMRYLRSSLRKNILFLIPLKNITSEN